MTKTDAINWETISINSLEFKSAEAADNLSQFLHFYFSRNNCSNQTFVVELSERHPDILINAIRTNRAFLRRDHVPALQFLKFHTNKNLRDHYLFFTKLAEYEQKFFDDYRAALSKTKSIDVLEVLVWVSLWFEEKRAGLFKTQQAHILEYDVHPFIEAIDYFLGFYLFDNKDKIKSTAFADEEDFKVLLKVLPEARLSSNISKQPVWESLDQAFRYLHYLKGTIEIYSFDLNYQLKINEGIAELKPINPNKLKNWYAENAKLAFWRNSHRQIATELVNYQISINPNFIPHKTELDYLMNYEGAIRATISEKVASDYSINESHLRGVPSKSLIGVLRGFVANAWGRFVTPMDALNYRSPDLWLKNIGLNIIEHGKRQIAAAPTRFMHESKFIEIIKNNIENFSETTAKNIIQMLSSDISTIDSIDRFNSPVNLSGKPFIKLNDHYFAFNGVLGESDSMTSILINRMQSNFKIHQSVTKKETDKLEIRVKDLFQNADLRSTLCSVNFAGNEVKGDFDVIVYENGVLLLIELKRSRARFHLSDAYDEYENSLKKASMQLDKAIHFISENFTECKSNHFKELNISESSFSELKVYSLIVSTSFEFDHNLIEDKHLKITLFELQSLLEATREVNSDNKLEDLTFSILRNQFWKDLESKIELSENERHILKLKI